LNAKFENFKDQIEKWSFPVQNNTVSNMHSSSSSDAANLPTKKGKKLKCEHPSPTNTKINPCLHEDHNPGEIRIESRI
jgi:hypothetical protein